jgi:hypothetical protein
MPSPIPDSINPTATHIHGTRRLRGWRRAPKNATTDEPIVTAQYVNCPMLPDG